MSRARWRTLSTLLITVGAAILSGSFWNWAGHHGLSHSTVMAMSVLCGLVIGATGAMALDRDL